MAYTRRPRRVRRTRRPRKATALVVAKRALKLARVNRPELQVAAVINAAATPGTTMSRIPLVVIAQGDDIGDRKADLITLKSLTIHCQLNGNDASTVDYCRIMVLQDKQQIADTTPVDPTQGGALGFFAPAGS